MKHLVVSVIYIYPKCLATCCPIKESNYLHGDGLLMSHLYQSYMSWMWGQMLILGVNFNQQNTWSNSNGFISVISFTEIFRCVSLNRLNLQFLQSCVKLLLRKSFYFRAFSQMHRKELNSVCCKTDAASPEWNVFSVSVSFVSGQPQWSSSNVTWWPFKTYSLTISK